MIDIIVMFNVISLTWRRKQKKNEYSIIMPKKDRDKSFIKRLLKQRLCDFEMFLIIMYVTMSHVSTHTGAK